MADISDNLAEELWLTAHALADAARGAILPHFRATGLDAENKEAGGFDPVTVADHAAETAMREVLAQRRPQDGILGEEQGIVEGTSGLTWVLDPIDGTQNFVHSLPISCVSIGLAVGGIPVLGVIYHPGMDELFLGLTAAAASPPLASDAHGSYLNGTRLRTDQKASTCVDMEL